MTIDATEMPAQSESDSGRIPLSYNQEFLSVFDEGNEVGPFGPFYHLAYGWRIRGHVDVECLRSALDSVVQRHEALRTLVTRGADGYQTVHPSGPPRLEVRDLPGTDPADRHRVAEELLIELECGPLRSDELPLLQAVLARFDDNDAVLALFAHHTAVDGMSMHVLIRDLSRTYARLRGHDLPALPEVSQYQEYVVWERERFADAKIARSRDYWREALQGAEFAAFTADRPKSASGEKKSAVRRLRVDDDLTGAVLDLARDTRCSVFMVMTAVYNVFLNRMLDITDVVVFTVSSGRGQARFQETVGGFFNPMPLRTDVAGCASFRDVLVRTRRTCLGAYSNQIPFAQVMADSPGLGRPFLADDVSVHGFQVFQFPEVMNAEVVGDVELTEIRRVLPQDLGSDLPDGALWTFDVDTANQDMLGCLQYNTNLFDEATIDTVVDTFVRVLRTLVTDPDAPLTIS
ncbi:condensation domain-containing protein [Actinophytocola algeriensis]|uniref:Condensation domain-containing protein n=1 Tax=Actinophytocola algeriensis TaxID=1768010 RepID=A0A7W7QFU0_9PSEU|nr:condensation domain-containing protein [Actinophytocola algeriensis]MBB4912842.1 hypothetical protein [Actinophytocola algeriensis]MBE1474124.1 hypothetical protein [Actinophytocola algeriensis]